jgi:hypothetical protein
MGIMGNKAAATLTYAGVQNKAIQRALLRSSIWDNGRQKELDLCNPIDCDRCTAAATSRIEVGGLACLERI